MAEGMPNEKRAEIRQELFQLPNGQSRSNSRYCLHKLSKHKNRNVTRSLHSIEVNRNSVNLQPKPKHTRTIILSDRQHKDSLSSQKPHDEQQSSKKRLFDRIIKLNNRSIGQKLQTIEGDALEEKEKKIKGCIQMMQGVLEEIQNQKSSRKVFKSIRYPHDKSADKATLEKKEDKSKFEEYIQNVCKSRQNSKVLLIRKAKTKSTLITNQDLKYSIVVNPKRFQTITNQQPKRQPIPVHPKRTPKIQIIVEKREEGEQALDSMQVSAIQRVNQSSFISDCGKKLLIGELSAEKNNLAVDLEQGKLKKDNSEWETGSGQKREKGSVQTNHRILCKVKNNKKLKNIFPSGFF